LSIKKFTNDNDYIPLNWQFMTAVIVGSET
jgi:hypothetical protein